MRNLLLVSLIGISCIAPSCTRHRTIVEEGEPGDNGPQGPQGEQGEPGVSFDYVRGINGAEICDRALVIPAHVFVPSAILAFAPVESNRHPEGLTLTFWHDAQRNQDLSRGSKRWRVLCCGT